MPSLSKGDGRFSMESEPSELTSNSESTESPQLALLSPLLMFSMLPSIRLELSDPGPSQSEDAASRQEKILELVHDKVVCVVRGEARSVLVGGDNVDGHDNAFSKEY